MNAHLVTIRKTTLRLERPVNHVGSDVEESGCRKRGNRQFLGNAFGNSLLRSSPVWTGLHGRLTLLLLLILKVVERVVGAVGSVVESEAVVSAIAVKVTSVAEGRERQELG